MPRPLSHYYTADFVAEFLAASDGVEIYSERTDENKGDPDGSPCPAQKVRLGEEIFVRRRLSDPTV